MLFTTNEGVVDGTPTKHVKPAFKFRWHAIYFPLFAGRDASKYANVKATPFIETLVNKKSPSKEIHLLFKKVMMFFWREKCTHRTLKLH